MELLHHLAVGFAVALTPANLLFALAGALIGTLIGVLPGIGPIATIAMLLPLTFHLEPTSGLIMLAGIFYGAQYGGSTAAILVNLPGETSSVVTCIDGHQMARQGRAGAALAVAALASFFAGCVATAADRHLCAAARQDRPVVRRAGIFLADGARPDRRGRAGARLGDQGRRHDHPRPVDRARRHRWPNRRDPLHLRHHRADRRDRRGHPRHRRVRHRRDHLELEPAAGAALADRAQDHAAVADARGFPARLAGGVARHRARLGARRAARRRRHLERVCRLRAGEEIVAASGRVRPRRGRGRGRTGIRQQCRRADLVHSRC